MVEDPRGLQKGNALPRRLAALEIPPTLPRLGEFHNSNPAQRTSMRSQSSESIGSSIEDISIEEAEKGTPSAGQFWQEQYALRSERAQSEATSSIGAERAPERDKVSPSKLRHMTSIVGQLTKQLWPECRCGEQRKVQDPGLPAPGPGETDAEMEAERQRNKSVPRRGSMQRRGSRHPNVAPRPFRPEPTLREQERLSCLVELGLLSFGSLAFEITRRTEIAKAASAPPVRRSSFFLSKNTRASVADLVKDNENDMTPA